MGNTGRSQRQGTGGVRVKPKATHTEGVLVPEAWVDARVSWVADGPRSYETSKWKDEPFKRYSVCFGIMTEDGMRAMIYCSMKWPMDDLTFLPKTSMWVLANMIMGEKYMEVVTDPRSDAVLDTADWLGKKLQIFPTVEIFRGENQSRVVINTFTGEHHIRIAREVDPTSTRLLWKDARSLGAPQDLMRKILKEFSIPTPNPSEWLRAEQELVNARLEDWVVKHRR